jgi:hypothetical protein
MDCTSFIGKWQEHLTIIETYSILNWYTSELITQ